MRAKFIAFYKINCLIRLVALASLNSTLLLSRNRLGTVRYCKMVCM